MKQPPQNDHVISGLFPIPIYDTHRDSVIEDEEIEDIIKEGMRIADEGDVRYKQNAVSNNMNIFDTKLKELKEFIEQHIKIYVKEIINPKEELDFYITQSWLNAMDPGGYHQQHMHQNSIISGVFYISTEEGDTITFADPSTKVKDIIQFVTTHHNVWTAKTWFFPVTNNKLILFPSWLDHQVVTNEKATTTRISISFNTFAKGIFGSKHHATELIL